MVPIMTPDNQFFHHLNGYPSNNQYVETTRSPSHNTDDYQIFNGRSQLQPTQQVMNTPGTSSNIFNSNYTFPASMPNLQNSHGWSVPTMISQQFQPLDNNPYLSNPNYCYSGYSAASLGNDQEQALLGDLNFSNVPRSSPTLYDTSMLNNENMGSDTYDPSLCQVQSREHQFETTSGSQFEPYPSCKNLDNSAALSRLSISQSPRLKYEVDVDCVSSERPEPSRAPSTPSDGDGRYIPREILMDTDDRGGEADEPYAKLIYRALMSAPNHSMVLQEIYRWFRENTSKGNSDSKGWMNSIRHNLSMNAAFKKTERKLPGDETKKSTEWVLEDFAVKDGVQSTTRYRSKSGAKKFFKSESPAPARQSSGRKGGLSTSKGKSRQRVKVDRQDRYHPLRQPHLGRDSHLQHHQPYQIDHQYPLSPSPPPYDESISSPSPYLFHTLGSNNGFSEDFCGLENVHGIHPDAPLFHDPSNDYEKHLISDCRSRL